MIKYQKPVSFIVAPSSLVIIFVVADDDDDDVDDDDEDDDDKAEQKRPIQAPDKSGAIHVTQKATSQEVPDAPEEGQAWASMLRPTLKRQVSISEGDEEPADASFVSFCAPHVLKV